MRFFTTPAHNRFFLIPDDHAPLIGDFALCDLDGNELYVDAEAISPFEISAERARPYLQADVLDALHQAGEELFGNLEHSTQALAELLGTATEELRARPSAAWAEAVRKALMELKEFLGTASTLSPAQLDRAREQLRALRLLLQAHGFKISEALDALVDRLRGLPPEAPERRAVQQHLDSLQALIERLERQ